MQVQKEEIRQAIIEKALDEFYKNGFHKASLRKIVKDAGATIGNFYNYFKNKEELFYAITEPVYNKFVFFIKSHNEDHYTMTEVSDLDIHGLRKIISDCLMVIDKDYEKALITLIDGSKGTKYENVKEEIKNFLAQHFEEHIKEAPQDKKINLHKHFSNVVAIGFLEGILNILRTNYPKEEKEKLIADYIIFYSLGGNAFFSI